MYVEAVPSCYKKKKKKEGGGGGGGKVGSSSMKSPTFGVIWWSFATAGQKDIPKGRARPQQGRKATGREGECKEPLLPGAVKQRRPGGSPWVGIGQAAHLPEDYSLPTRAKPRADRDNKRK